MNDAASNLVIAETADLPLLIDARAAAILCGISRATWWSLHSAGRVPLPIRLGRRTLWRREEVAAWVAAGCPSRDRWDVMRGSRR